MTDHLILILYIINGYIGRYVSTVHWLWFIFL